MGLDSLDFYPKSEVLCRLGRKSRGVKSITTYRWIDREPWTCRSARNPFFFILFWCKKKKRRKSTRMQLGVTSPNRPNFEAAYNS